MIIVQKFGGSSLGTIEKIKNVAKIVEKEIKNGNKVITVVSAMQGETDKLLLMAREIANPTDLDLMSEYDVISSTGEQVSAGLLSLALQSIGIKAKSLLNWQIKLRTNSNYTNARIEEIVNSQLIIEELNSKDVIIIAGFQGITDKDRITTLGRGGSDTSAVAVAISVNAERCDIYKDVDGIYTADPRICSEAKKMDEITLEEMLELSSTGSKVLQVRSIELAMKYGMKMCVRSTFDLSKTGTLLVKELKSENKKPVTGISHTTNEALFYLFSRENFNLIEKELIFKLLNDNIHTDLIVRNSYSKNSKSISFTVNKSDLSRLNLIIEDLKFKNKLLNWEIKENVCKISLVGFGMKKESGVIGRVFEVLSKFNIEILSVSTSDIKISLIVNSKYLELAVRLLHAEFDLCS